MADGDTTYDEIKRPRHYNFGKYQVIDVIEDWGLGYNLGNAVKYIARAQYKGSMINDLKKAEFYIDRQLISTPENTSEFFNLKTALTFLRNEIGRLEMVVSTDLYS